MGDLQRPLIPQFSIRWVLAVTAALAVVSLVISLAVRGVAWAGGVSIGFAALVIAFAVYALLFAVVWLFSGLMRRRGQRSADRPATTGSSNMADGPAAIALFIACWLAISPGAALAASGGAVMYPMLGPKEVNNTGLMLTLDASWVDSCGYRPITVEVKSITGPVTADRLLTIQFCAGQWEFDGTSTKVIQQIEIPAGLASAKATIAVPQRQPWMNYEWDVFEDGQHVKQLSSGAPPLGFMGGNNSYFGDGGPPAVLLLSGLGQISVNHLTVFGQTEESVIFAGRAALSPQVGQVPAPAAAPGGFTGIATFADLPTRWIDYSGIDIIVSSLDELEALVDIHPAQWQAIRRWQRAGGTQVVYGVGNRWQRLAELESLIDVATESESHESPNDEPQNGDEINPTSRGWILPREDIRDLPLSGAQGETLVIDEAEALDAALTAAKRTNDPLTGTNPPFVLRPSGDGMTVAIRSEDDFTGVDFPWAWFYNTLGLDRWQWYQRNGVSLTNENADFWNFLIPGVGAAPVTQFQVLITLFVLAIGPVNYYLLRRIGKLNLMVITVPLCALAITCALVLYALVADGLGVRLRARSLTHLDQRTGEAICWARLSYYAGLAPSGGLRFSDQTAVLPLEPEPIGLGEGAPRTLDWARIHGSDPASPLEQRLLDGWLKARTPTQFITARARQTDAKLRVDQADAEQPPKVTNQLGAGVQRLVLVDEQGKCFTGEQIGVGEPVELKSAESQSAAAFALIEPLMVENEPQVQVELENNSGFFGVNRSRSRYPRSYAGGINNSGVVVPAQQSTGMLERSMRELRRLLTGNLLPPRSYVAVVEASPEMERGTPAAREEASFHIVVGTW